jgi:hypothetical protein
VVTVVAGGIHGSMFAFSVVTVVAGGIHGSMFAFSVVTVVAGGIHGSMFAFSVVAVVTGSTHSSIFALSVIVTAFMAHVRKRFPGSGLDHVEEIKPVAEKHNCRSEEQGTKLSFGVVTHQDEERCDEVQQYVTPEEYRIIIHSCSEVDRFLTNVSVPNQHELAEPYVGPENRNGEKVLTKIVEMLLVDTRKVAAAL